MPSISLGGFDGYEPLLTNLKDVAVVVFLAGTMVAMGSRLSPGDVTKITREYNLVARWFLANMLAVPVFAMLLGVVFSLSRPVLLSLLLVSVAPGAPFIPTLAALSGEDSHEATRLTASLTVVAALSVPLLTAGALLFLRVEGTFVPWRFLVPLVLVLVAPLLIGGALRAVAPTVAGRLVRPLELVAQVTLLSVLVLIVVLSPGETIRVFARLVGTGTLLVFVVFIFGTIAIGWLVGGPTSNSRRILALGTAGRNVGIALFIAASAFEGENADSEILAFTILMLAVSVLVAWYWRRKSDSEATSPPSDTEGISGEV
ncbi:hypothetical protein AUR66_19450 [Haloferax profundi]|uniref:Uncharacterized protein n=2 Tax=Haloferax profundi TaxID=1544718 RepID=A0A0W1RJM1_9EURY|nr:hypothetical protein AUR66_19450 [Haloferax profundi]